MKSTHLIAALFLGSAALYGQTPTADLPIHITAVTRSSQTTRDNFGPLRPQYASVGVSACNTGDKALTIPLAMIGQQPGVIPDGVTLLMPTEALQVIAAAQGNTKKAKAFRIGIAVVEGAAVATSLAGISATLKNALTDTAILGGQLIPIIAQASTATNLVNYAQATLADPLQLIPGGCASGIVLTESDPKARRADFRMR